MNNLIDFLIKQNIEFYENVSAKELCSFRAGGSVRVAANPKSTDELISLLDFVNEQKIKHTVIGKGSNILFFDGEYRGLVITTYEMNRITVSDKDITAEAGATLFSLATFAEKNSLTGVEFAHGIPGSVGGAVYMNAGAYGGEIKDVLLSCTCYDTEKRKVLEFSNRDCDFSYRHSAFTDRKNLIILSASFALYSGDKKRIREKMDDFKARRKEKQPLEYPSAGSSFKRPEGYFAGKLIEDAGLKGFCIGGACISEKHAGFIVNKGDASASDIMKTAEYVKEKVKEKFGVALECEFEFLSED